MAEDSGKQLHIVMLPWLAMGHLLPFFELSKRLAKNGHRVFFLSSPGNLRRLPSIPASISHLLELVPCPLPSTEKLPALVESTIDLPSYDVLPFLVQAYHSFEHQLANFLDEPSQPIKPDWIIYDTFGNRWVPTFATQHGLRCASFSVFNAAMLSFFGTKIDHKSPEELTKVLEWIPFPTTVAFTPFEARQCFPILQMISKISARGQNNRGNFMAVKTCREFEPEWLDLLGKILVGFPIVPVGFLPPSFDDDEESQPWVRIAAWLDRREPGSVLYAAFGSELKFTTEQIDEIASGLERGDVPFVWALREGCVPDRFEERVGDRGIVVEGWVPQARILSHSSIGAFLNHGGPSGIVEGLMPGVALVVLPMQFEQGLNARLLSEKGLG
ncbi:hypothetical protein HPP92_013303 [Vanilla planifolia]|uniref:Uncharacterized protein n=1 Tax=Vanilla planifolia TaxID=51239 RepID=A0A835UWL7_VANPL|nr:hypothetical protein HPP92_013303 [Vanilla planifolia]